MFKKLFIIIFFSSVSLFVGFQISDKNLYAKISNFINNDNNKKNTSSKEANLNDKKFIGRYDYPDINEDDLKMAKNLIKGGYILYFRHAEREKWIDVQMYDALEANIHSNGLNSTRFAENTYFKNSVCLNNRGLVQAKAIGEMIKHSKLPYSFIISSPSCRARQTAELGFGRYDKIDHVLMHRTVYNENLKTHLKDLKKLFLSVPLNNNSNTIITAHNAVIHEKLFDKINPKIAHIRLEEGGFAVIERKNGKLFFVHKFYTFNGFSKVFHLREGQKN